MNNRLTKSKVWQIIGVAVLCAVCVLTAVLGVVFGMNHSSEDLNVSKDMSNQDNIVVETVHEEGIKLTIDWYLKNQDWIEHIEGKKANLV